MKRGSFFGSGAAAVGGAAGGVLVLIVAAVGFTFLTMSEKDAPSGIPVAVPTVSSPAADGSADRDRAWTIDLEPSTVLEPSVATEPEHAPEASPDTLDTSDAAGPMPPRLDLVRVGEDGTTVLAGHASPDLVIEILIDGEVIYVTSADASGDFGAVVLLDPSDSPRVLGIEGRGEDDRTVAGAETVIIAPFGPPVAALADPVPDASGDPASSAGPAEVSSASPAAPGGPDGGTTPDIVADREAATDVIVARGEAMDEAAPGRVEAPAAGAGSVWRIEATQPAPSDSGVTGEFPTDSDVADLVTREEGSPPDPNRNGPSEVIPPDAANETAADAASPGPAPDPTAGMVPRVSEATDPEPPQTPPLAPMSSPAPDAQAPGALATAPVRPTAPDVAASAPPAEISSASPAQDTPARPGAAAPSVIIAGPDGIRISRDSGPEPLAQTDILLDAISYTPEGAVILAGRGPAERDIRVTLDAQPIQLGEIGPGGDWSLQLPDVDPGTYTLVVAELADDGSVASQVETPFLREDPARLAAVPAQGSEAGVDVITVQPGFTLWGIAQNNFGEGILYVQIFEENRDQIRDPDWIFPGQIFRLPELPRVPAED